MCVYVVDKIRTLSQRETSLSSSSPFKFRDLIFNSLEKISNHHMCTYEAPAMQSLRSPRLPGITRIPSGRLLLCWVTCFAPATADTHTAADSEPQQGSEDQGTSRSSLFNFGKTQCSLHSNVAKWCHDPLALGSPIQRATSHTALQLPTAWFCV